MTHDSNHGGTHSGDYDSEPDIDKEQDMTTKPERQTTGGGGPLIEPGIGESEDGLFFEPAQTIARVKAVIASAFTLAGSLGITFVAGDAEVQSALETVASLGIGLVAAVLVAWNALSQGTRTRDSVFAPSTVEKLTKGQRE